MDITLGQESIHKTHQNSFRKEIFCSRCSGTSRIAFVAHEGIDSNPSYSISEYYNNEPNSMWVHDYVAVAVYFCTECLNADAKFNQA